MAKNINISEGYPQLLQADLVLWFVPAKYLLSSVPLHYTVRDTIYLAGMGIWTCNVKFNFCACNRLMANAHGQSHRAPVAFYLFGVIQTPLRIQSLLIAWLVTPLLWKRRRVSVTGLLQSRSSFRHATLLPKNGCWAWPVCGEERCVTTQRTAVKQTKSHN